jgi:hypothetical protein
VSQQRVVLSHFCDVTVDPSGPSCKYLVSLDNVLEPVSLLIWSYTGTGMTVGPGLNVWRFLSSSIVVICFLSTHSSL